MAALAMASICLGAHNPKKASAKKNAMSNLGDVMFIGDSITHGYDSPSYRWALHKILVDNGIEFDVVGIETGNREAAKAGVKPETLYIGKMFNNKHCAMSSQRAYETSGRDHVTWGGNKRLDNTDILDWLKLDEEYTGPRKIDGDAPDTYFILLGTNDLLSDTPAIRKKVAEAHVQEEEKAAASDKKKGDRADKSRGTEKRVQGEGKAVSDKKKSDRDDKNDGIGKHIQEVEKALLDRKNGDMSVIVDAIRRANKKARIVVLTIPTWRDDKINNTAKDYAVVLGGYNKRLVQWAKSKRVIPVDVNKGLIDVANTETPGKGVPSLYSDNVHPNERGDLLLAGHVAQALGIAGRSAGLPRKGTGEFSLPMSKLVETATEKEGVEATADALTIAPGKKLVAPWSAESDLTRGFSFALTLTLGDGAANGWETDQGLDVQVGSGTAVSGTLTITESYLKWGGETIYSADMSQNQEPIRVAWTPGNPDFGVKGGFYVWLGDMLVGEGLPPEKSGVKGVSLSNTSGRAVVIKDAAAEPAAVAPSPKGFVKEETTIDPKL